MKSRTKTRAVSYFLGLRTNRDGQQQREAERRLAWKFPFQCFQFSVSSGYLVYFIWAILFHCLKEFPVSTFQLPTSSISPSSFTVATHSPSSPAVAEQKRNKTSVINSTGSSRLLLLLLQHTTATTKQQKATVCSICLNRRVVRRCSHEQLSLFVTHRLPTRRTAVHIAQARVQNPCRVCAEQQQYLYP